MGKNSKPPNTKLVEPPIPEDVPTKNVDLASAQTLDIPRDGEIYPPGDDVPIDPDAGRAVLTVEEVNSGGRLYRPEFAAQTQKLCRLGATDIELADFFGVSWMTIRAWRTRVPAFELACREGKDALDARVERSLYTRAVGYTYDAVKIFMPREGGEPVKVAIREHVPPDTTACIFWLKNRQPDRWRDMRHGQLVGNILNVTISAEQAKW